MSDKELPKINIHGHLRYNKDLKERIKIWDEWNVQYFCCLCVDPRFPWGGWHGENQGYYDSEDYLKIKDEYGERIIGFASVAHTCEEIDTPENIERYKEQGFTGLKFCGNSYPYNHEIYLPIYEKAQELQMPILFHTGCLAVSETEEEKRYKIAGENMRPYLLEPLARYFPNLKIIGAHLGQPHCFEALSIIETYANIYYDFSGGGGSKVHVRKVLSALLPHPGLETNMEDPEENRALKWFEKFCFGTDNPEPTIWVSNSEFIMDQLQIPLETRKKFYFDTAASILNISK